MHKIHAVGFFPAVAFCGCISNNERFSKESYIFAFNVCPHHRMVVDPEKRYWRLRRLESAVPAQLALKNVTLRKGRDTLCKVRQSGTCCAEREQPICTASRWQLMESLSGTAVSSTVAIVGSIWPKGPAQAGPATQAQCITPDSLTICGWSLSIGGGALRLRTPNFQIRRGGGTTGRTRAEQFLLINGKTPSLDMNCSIPRCVLL